MVKAPVLSKPGSDDSSCTTMEVGIAGVSGLLVRSDTADKEFRPFGVTRQAQQAISSSAGSKV